MVVGVGLCVCVWGEGLGGAGEGGGDGVRACVFAYVQAACGFVFLVYLVKKTQQWIDWELKGNKAKKKIMEEKDLFKISEWKEAFNEMRYNSSRSSGSSRGNSSSGSGSSCSSNIIGIVIIMMNNEWYGTTTTTTTTTTATDDGDDNENASSNRSNNSNDNVQLCATYLWRPFVHTVNKKKSNPPLQGIDVLMLNTTNKHNMVCIHIYSKT